jgi:hypothetical protein
VLALARTGQEGTPMLKVVDDAEASNENAAGRSLLDEIVCDGARQMLPAALQAEVSACVESFADEVDEHGRRLVVRNGYHALVEVATAAGSVPVKAPRVSDQRTDPVTGERKRFATATLLPAWARKSPRVAEVLPLLYLHGLSSQTSGRRWSSSSARPLVVSGDDHPASPRNGRTRRPRSTPLPGGHRLRVRVG